MGTAATVLLDSPPPTPPLFGPHRAATDPGCTDTVSMASSSTKPTDGQLCPHPSLSLYSGSCSRSDLGLFIPNRSMYPLDLRLDDPIVLTMVSVEPVLGVDLGFGVEKKKNLEGDESIGSNRAEIV